MFHVPILLLGLTLTGLVASLACASSLPTGLARTRLSSPPAAASALEVEVGADARVHPSIDEAVEAAFAAAERGVGAREQDRLRIGTIRRVEGGFRWTEPIASATAVGAMTSMQVRLRLGPEDVAIFGLHPRSGQADVDRLNEAVNRHERRLVDEVDPLHRPLYVQTPSRRVLRYPALPASVEVVRRDEEAVPRR